MATLLAEILISGLSDYRKESYGRDEPWATDQYLNLFMNVG